ncbi:GlsB/YeaQ/YmgE family stress response membrane protein [Sediminibacterium sp.]|uniref:GlsB/YeaQ/YmgE family stress response membrane protein n=1 Tax=Sediminibacterium sp. TaxID=1917865 RepID=UPI003F6F7749
MGKKTPEERYFEQENKQRIAEKTDRELDLAAKKAIIDLTNQRLLDDNLPIQSPTKTANTNSQYSLLKNGFSVIINTILGIAISVIAGYILYKLGWI